MKPISPTDRFHKEPDELSSQKNFKRSKIATDIDKLGLHHIAAGKLPQIKSLNHLIDSLEHELEVQKEVRSRGDPQAVGLDITGSQISQRPNPRRERWVARQTQRGWLAPVEINADSKKNNDLPIERSEVA